LIFDPHKNIIELHSKYAEKYPVYFCHLKSLEKVITISGKKKSNYLNVKKMK